MLELGRNYLHLYVFSQIFIFTKVYRYEKKAFREKSKYHPMLRESIFKQTPIGPPITPLPHSLNMYCMHPYSDHRFINKVRGIVQCPWDGRLELARLFICENNTARKNMSGLDEV